MARKKSTVATESPPANPQETVTSTEAAKMVGVSKPRWQRIAKDCGIEPAFITRVNNWSAIYWHAEDVRLIAETRAEAIAKQTDEEAFKWFSVIVRRKLDERRAAKEAEKGGQAGRK